MYQNVSKRGAQPIGSDKKVIGGRKRRDTGIDRIAQSLLVHKSLSDNTLHICEYVLDPMHQFAIKEFARGFGRP